MWIDIDILAHGINVAVEQLFSTFQMITERDYSMFEILRSLWSLVMQAKIIMMFVIWLFYQANQCIFMQ